MNAPSGKWLAPLDEFLGEHEPDDDDRSDWYIRDIVPRGEPMLWAGPPKSGKTWAALDLAISLAFGQPWLMHENCVGEPVRVFVLALEDGQRRLRKRVWELARGRGLTPNNLGLREHLMISRESLRLPADKRAFTDALKTWKPGVVLIDNLTRVLEGDPNATKDAAQFGLSWLSIGSDLGASVCFLHHVRKSGEGRGSGWDVFDTIKGNGDFVALARHALLTKRGGVEGVSEVQMRGNLDLHRERFTLGFEREQRTDGKWTARLVDRGNSEERDDGVTRKLLAAALASDVPLSRNTLAEKAGVRKQLALAVIRVLVGSGKLVEVAGHKQGVLLVTTPERTAGTVK